MNCLQQRDTVFMFANEEGCKYFLFFSQFALTLRANRDSPPGNITYISGTYFAVNDLTIIARF